MSTLTKRTKRAQKEKSLTQIKKELDDASVKMAKIILDPDRPYHEKLTFINHEIKESVRPIEFQYQLNGFFEDAAYALHRAVTKVHGFSEMQNQKSASKENPPQMVDVKFADGSRIKVPYGSINLPQFGKDAYIEMTYDKSRNIMHLHGTCEKRHSIIMDSIVENAEKILKEDSIYKNKAIRYDGNDSPAFMDLSNINSIELFLTERAKFATEPIEARIERTDECIKNDIDIKFGVLLEGDYGTGKTLYANKLAYKAILNDWTFIYCAKPEAALKVLKMANKFTSNGRGVVLFIEDIDKILMNRDNVTNEISLLMDGSETKHNNIISIFSTNHIENIDPTFLRGKRIGSIVTLEYLDEVTADKMIQFHLKGYLTGSSKKAAAKVEEYKIVPAFLQEIIDRVKTHTILRGNKKVTQSDILNAIEQYKRQMDIARVKVDTETTLEKYHNAKAALMAEVVEGAINANDKVEHIYDNI